MLKKNLLPAFIFFSIFCFTAFRPSADCMKLLKDSYRKLSISEPPVDDKTYFMEYEMKTVYRDKTVDSPALRVKMYLDKDHSQIISQYMEVYQDRKDCFTILPGKKLIYRADSQFGRKDTTGNISLIQDKILDQCQVKSCEEVTLEGKLYKQIVLEPAKELKQKIEVEKITFHMDMSNNMIFRQDVIYSEDSKYEKIKLTYLSLDFDYKKTNINYSASSKFFKKDGSLLPLYKGFQFSDVRKKSK